MCFKHGRDFRYRVALFSFLVCSFFSIHLSFFFLYVFFPFLLLFPPFELRSSLAFFFFFTQYIRSSSLSLIRLYRSLDFSLQLAKSVWFLHLLYSLAFISPFQLNIFFCCCSCCFITCETVSLLSVNRSSLFYLFASFLFFFSLPHDTGHYSSFSFSIHFHLPTLLFLNFFHMHTFLPSLIFLPSLSLSLVLEAPIPQLPLNTEYLSSLIRSNFP